MENEFKELQQALLCWYPFRKNWKVLAVGTDDALKEYLEQHVFRVDAVRAEDVCRIENEQYDCIVLIDTLEQYAGEQMELMKKLYGLLKEGGVLLIGFRNRFGMKYLCGKVDDLCPVPFANYEEGTRLLSKQHVDGMAATIGFAHAFHYYPLPDRLFVQAVYSDAKLPAESIHDRVFPFDPYGSAALFPESEMLRTIIRENKLQDHANYILVEYRKTPRPEEEVYPTAALLSADRGEEHSFTTVFLSDHTVLKQALYPAGQASLQIMFDNLEALGKRGLMTVGQKLTEAGIRMPEVWEETLLAMIGRLIREKNREGLLRLFDLLYENVLKSSDKTDRRAVLDSDWTALAEHAGPVLQKAYIDMIPYNGFWTGDDIRYYDQEFVRYNCPAKYVIFRAVYYTFIHYPEMEQVIPQCELKSRFGLDTGWDVYVQAENRFVADNRNWEKYGKIYEWAHEDRNAITKLRLDLKTAGRKEYNTGLLMGVFDLFHVGHLRLIQRAKEHCSCLRVAVLSDELVMKFKHHAPVIPLAERMEILAAVREVDEVVAIYDDPSRLLEYSRRPFDCFFSGDDYADNDYWKWEKEELRKLGSDIMFFSYTQQQSSTRIRTILKAGEDSLPAAACPEPAADAKPRYRAVIWGTGKVYRSMRETLRCLEKTGRIEIAAVTQTELLPVTTLDGWPAVPKEELRKIQYDYIIVCSRKYFDDIADTITKLTGLPRTRILSCDSVMSGEYMSTSA